MENEVSPSIPPFQSTPPPPATPSKNWSKIIIFILIGLVVVAGSTYAGIQIGKNQIVKQPLVVEQPTIIPTQTIIINPTTALPTKPNPTTDPTADWKTYTDGTYKFSFKYPIKGNIQKLEKRDSLLLGGAVFKLIYGNEFRPQTSEIYTYVYNKNGLGLNEWIKTNSTIKPFGSEEKEFSGYVDLGQKNIDKFIGVNFRSEIMGFVSHNVAVDKGDYIYVVGQVEVADDLSNEYDQILSTFKFTN